jgi:hypothetical protein
MYEARESQKALVSGVEFGKSFFGKSFIVFLPRYMQREAARIASPPLCRLSFYAFSD